MAEKLVVDMNESPEAVVVAAERPFVRSAYNYDVDMVSESTGLECRDVSRTQQSFAEEVDINTIVERFGLTGQLPTNIPQVFSGDFTQVVDFQSAHNLLREAIESFEAMPANVRSEFDNDPHKFVEFFSQEANYDRAVALGLVREEVVQARKARADAERKAEIDRQVEAQLAARKAAGGA